MNRDFRRQVLIYAERNRMSYENALFECQKRTGGLLTAESVSMLNNSDISKNTGIILRTQERSVYKMGRLFANLFNDCYKIKKKYKIPDTPKPTSYLEKEKRNRKLIGYSLFCIVLWFIVLLLLNGTKIQAYFYFISLLAFFVFVTVKKGSDKRDYIDNLEENINNERMDYYQKFALCCAILNVDTNEKLDELSADLLNEMMLWEKYNSQMNGLMATVASAGIINQLVNLFSDKTEAAGYFTGIITLCALIIVILYFLKTFCYSIRWMEYNDFIVMRSYFSFFKLEGDVLDQIRHMKELISEAGQPAEK